MRSLRVNRILALGCFAVAFGSLAMTGTRAVAQTSTYLWNASSGTAWNSGADWVGGVVPVTGSIAWFNSGTYTSKPSTGGIAESVGAVWANGSGTLTISSTASTGTLTLTGTTTPNFPATQMGIEMDNGAGALTISAPIVLGGSQTWYNNSSNALTISGTVTGAAANSLTTSGSGIIALGNINNSFSGNITVSGGTLQATGAGAVSNPTASDLGSPRIARTITVNNGGVLQFTAGNVLGQGGNTTPISLVIGQSGLVTSTANNNNLLGPVTLSGGTLTGLKGGGNGPFWTWQLTGGSVTANTAPSLMTISLTNTDNGYNLAATTTFNVAQTIGPGYDLTVSAPLVDQSGTPTLPASLVKIGAGTMALSSTDYFSGTTLVNGGLLVLANSAALLNSSFNTSGTGALSFGTLSSATFGGLQGGGTLALTNSGATAPVALTVGNFIFPAGVTTSYGSSLSSTTFSGALSDGGLGGSLTKIGSNTLTLGGNNTYTGPTLVSKGAIVLTGSLGTGTVTVAGGTTFSASASSLIAGSVALNGSMLSAGAINGSVNVNSGGTLTTLNSTIGGGLTVNGSGALTLAVANSATPLTVGNGLTLGSAAGGYAAGNYATLSYTVSANGTQPVNLGASAMTLNSGGAFVNVSFASTPPTGSVYPLINFGSQSLTGSFSLSPSTPNVTSLPIGRDTFNLVDNANALQLQILGPPIPGVAYFYGAVSSVWSDLSNSTSCNWSSNVQGTQDALNIPSLTTDVIMTASTLSGSSVATTLGANTVINSLNVNSQAASNTINADGSTLTINALADSNTSSSGYTGNPAGNGISIAAGAGSVTIGVPVFLGGSQTWSNSSANGLALTNNVSGAAGPSNTQTLTLANAAAGGMTFSGAIVNGTAGGKLAVVINNTGAGTTLFAGSSTYTGGTMINNGTLQVTSANGLPSGAGTGNVVLSSTGGGFLDLDGTQVVDINGLAGGGGTSLGQVINSATGTVATLNLGNGSGSATYSGVIADNNGIGGQVALVKSGSGTQVLSGSNTYSGGTAINRGVMSVANPGALSSGNIQFGGGALQFTAGNTNDYSGVIVNSNSAISIDTNGQTVTFASNLAFSNIGGLTKLGGGMLVLAGNNAYSGATVISGGTLSVTGTNSLPTGTWGVTIGSTSGSPATMDLGPASVANLSSGSVTVSFGSTLTIEPGASFTTGGFIKIASLANNVAGGTLNQLGGTVSITGFDSNNRTLAIGEFGGDTGVYNLSGGSLSAPNGTVYLPWNGNGIFNITGGSASFGKVNLSGSTSTLSLTGGGALYLGSGGLVLGVTSDALSITLDNGTIGSTAPWTWPASIPLALTYTGGTNFDASGGSITMSSVMSGSGGLTEVGSGILILRGNNTYSGSTTISSGGLVLTGSLGTGLVTVVGGATLAGSASSLIGGSVNVNGTMLFGGAINGSVNVNSGGTLTTGNATIGGGLAVNGGGATVSGGAINGSVNVNGGGTLTTNNSLIGGSLAVIAGGATVSGGTINGSANVNSGGTLTTGLSIIGGSLAVNGGGALTLAIASSATSLTVGNGLTLGSSAGGYGAGNYATLTYTVSSNGTQPVNLGASALTVNSGGAFVDVSFGTTPPAGAVYPLINFGSQNGPGSFSLSPSVPNVTSLSLGRGTCDLVDNANVLQLQIVGPPSPGVAYFDGVVSNVWADLSNATTCNWSLNVNGTQTTATIPGAATDVILSANNLNGSAVSTVLGGQFTINSLNVFAGAASTTISTSGAGDPSTLTINALADSNTNSSGYTGNPAGNGISIAAGAGPVTIGVPVLLGNSQTWTNRSASGLALTNSVNGSATSGNTQTLTLTNAASGGMTLSGAIGNGSAGGNLAVVISNTGAGTTVFAGSSTYTGGTMINYGTLQVTSANGLPSGAGTGNVVLSSTGGGFLDLDGTSMVFINGLAGGGGTSLGQVINSAIGTVATLNLGNGGGSATYSGVIADNNGGGGQVALAKSGSGTEVLSGSNTYTGGTAINGGVLSLANPGALSSGNIQFGGGTMQFTASNTNDYSALIFNSSGPISVDTNGQNVTFASNLDSSNLGGLTKAGGGMLILAGNNAYSGPTLVSAGTLSVTGTNSLPPNTWGVTIGTISSSAATMVLGSSSVTNLTSGSVTVSYGSTLTIQPGASFTTGGFVKLGSLAVGSSGIINQLGGTVLITGFDSANGNRSLTIGEFSAETSTYNLSGGSLTVPNGVVFLPWTATNGILNITGGSASFQKLELGVGNGNSSSTLELTGGGALYLGSGGLVLGSTNDAPNITLDNGTVGATAPWTWSASVPLTLTYSGGTNFDASGGKITLSNPMSGSGGLTEVGSGVVSLNANNSFTGNVLVSSGTLQPNVNIAATANPTSTPLGNPQLGNRTITVNNGGVLDFTAGNVMGAGGATVVVTPLVINSGGLVTNGNGSFNNVLGPVTLSGGTLTGGNGGASGLFLTWELTAGSVMVNTAPSLMANYGVSSVGFNMAATTTFNVGLTGTGGTTSANPDLTVTARLGDQPGALQGSGNPAFSASLVKIGAGTMLLAASDTYSGSTLVDAGVLQLGNAAALGTGALAANGGTLDLAGYSVTVPSFSGAAGTVLSSSAGQLATLTVSQSSSTSFNGSIIDGPGQVGLTLNGPGTLVLGGTNTYSGGTVVDAGTLIENSASALPTGSSLTVGADASSIFAPVSAAPLAASPGLAVASVPEPAAFALLGVGALGLVAFAWRKRKKAR